MKTKFLALSFILIGTLSFAQVKLADKFFKNYGYVKAIELYEKAVEKGDSSAHVLTRLGDAYYNNSKSEEAARWYGAALSKYNRLEAEYLYKYIQSLRSIGEFEEADKWFKELMAVHKGDSRLKGYNPDEVDIYDKLTSKNELVVNVENAPFNSENSDFGAYVHDNTVYFASASSEGEKLYSWNKEPFLDLYEAPISISDGIFNFGPISTINSEDINSDYHEASVAITNDGKTLYFTRDNVNKRNRLKYDKKGTTHLKIYKAKLVDSIWSEVEELPFNDDVYSTGHPALSPDNKTLYFVSDREGGIGQTDIYSASINEDGSYGTPENLGEFVNTEGREMFPFMAKDSTLYFSSDGHLNLGLLDIFKSNILKGERSEPENLGSPYNSGYDDFAFFINSEEQVGFFSSNRPEGKGSDDIYTFDSRPCKEIIAGSIKDSETGILLSGTVVRLIDETGKIIEEVHTEDKNDFSFTVDCNKTYTVVASKMDYKENQVTVNTTDDNNKVNSADIVLTPLIIDNQIVINPIFFDFDKWNIRTDAQYELENIVDVLRKHPTMVIKIESHTDSRGGDRYNMKLSDRRAKSTRDYLISRGIAPNRIESAIGYGETQLLNNCSNGVKCSEEEHQMNRRSYFYIVSE